MSITASASYSQVRSAGVMVERSSAKAVSVENNNATTNKRLNRFIFRSVLVCKKLCHDSRQCRHSLAHVPLLEGLADAVGDGADMDKIIVVKS